MDTKYERSAFSLASLAKTVGRVPTWQAVGSALIVILVGTMVLYAMTGSRDMILGHYTVILTVLIWLTYEYAKSVEAMAKATFRLARTGEKESLVSKAKRITEEGIILQEFLEELRKAEKTSRPPFELFAWESNNARLESLRELADFEKQKIVSCYKYLVKQNAEISHWQELQTRLQGLVNTVERRRTALLLKAMEQENRSAVKTAISILKSYLG